MSNEHIKILHDKNIRFPLEKERIQFQFRCFGLNLSPPKQIERSLFTLIQAKEPPLLKAQQDWIKMFFKEHPEHWQIIPIAKQWTFYHLLPPTFLPKLPSSPKVVEKLPDDSINQYFSHYNLFNWRQASFDTELALAKRFLKQDLYFDPANLPGPFRFFLLSLPYIEIPDKVKKMDPFTIHLYFLLYITDDSQWTRCSKEVQKAFRSVSLNFKAYFSDPS